MGTATVSFTGAGYPAQGAGPLLAQSLLPLPDDGDLSVGQWLAPLGAPPHGTMGMSGWYLDLPCN